MTHEMARKITGNLTQNLEGMGNLFQRLYNTVRRWR